MSDAPRAFEFQGTAIGVKGFLPVEGHTLLSRSDAFAAVILWSADERGGAELFLRSRAAHKEAHGYGIVLYPIHVLMLESLYRVDIDLRFVAPGVTTALRPWRLVQHSVGTRDSYLLHLQVPVDIAKVLRDNTVARVHRNRDV
jgi:hypothetical protein